MAMRILPHPEVFVSRAREAFNKDGSLSDEKLHEQLKELVLNTLEEAKK